ncbi:MAG: sterol desaturase family protein [Hyphomonadaceae bacterium]|nr:sterol desaturase family protein [Hyphomonadaceae bacterium]
MITALLSAKTVLIAIWFAVLALGERLAPAAPRPPGEARVLRNLVLWGANTLMSPFLTVPVGAAAAALQIWTRPDLGWTGLALDLVALDLWTYAWHRANHVWPLLWRFHRVHHLDRFLDTTSAVRFHPGEVLISALARAPLIIALDIPLLSLVVFDTLVLASALFHHSNVRLPAPLESVLRVIIVTPSHHWVHHHTLRADTDSNYGALLTLWDRLFASWSPHQRTPYMAIGAGDDPDGSLAMLAAAPFTRQR